MAAGMRWKKMQLEVTAALVVLAGACCVMALDNGLALTPPMGWLSWQRYRCITDCVKYPDGCINENLYMAMADRLVTDGYRDVGYEYVNIDDCWMSKERDANGSLVADPARFPHGIKALADYVHSKGLKLGIYEDFGTHTCGGYPGSKFYLEKDAQTFADWGIDMLKLDGCYTDVADMEYGYPAMSFFLNQTGRPILYSCSWPAYIVYGKTNPDYKKIAKYCNIWRNYGDIDDSWDSVKSIIEFYGTDKGSFQEVAAPGSFNDPDMSIVGDFGLGYAQQKVQMAMWAMMASPMLYFMNLIVGDFGLSYAQQKVQMAMWAMMASPMFMSNDLRSVPAASKQLLQNKQIIAVNQDPLGMQGRRVLKIKDIEMWSKPLAPKGKSVAFAVLNMASGGNVEKISPRLKDLGAKWPGTYDVTEVFSGAFVGTFKPQDTLNITVTVDGVYFAVAHYNQQ